MSAVIDPSTIPSTVDAAAHQSGHRSTRAPSIRHGRTGSCVSAFLRALCACALLLSACARRGGPAPEIASGGAPSWTFRRPDDPAILYGLGRAPLGGDTRKARETALTLARDDLLKALKERARQWAGRAADGVDPSLIDAAWDRVVWDRMESVIARTAASEWYEETERARVWVLLTLDAGALDAELSHYRAHAQKVADSALARASTAARKGNLIGELKAQASALLPLTGPEGLTLPAPGKPGKTLRGDVEDRLLETFSRVTITVEDAPGSVRPGAADAPLVARAAAGGPVRLPLRYDFTRGEGTLGEPEGPDGQGRTRIRLETITTRDHQIALRVTPDLGALLDADELDAQILRKAVDPAQLPGALITIDIIPARVLLTYIERGGTGGQRGGLLVDELSAILSDAGAELVEADVGTLLQPDVYEQVAAGNDRDTAPHLEGVDLIGVAIVELQDYDTQGRAPQVHAASGEGQFRLFDLNEQRYKLEVTTGTFTYSGFSEGDAERGFFLQASDLLRDRVRDAVEERDVLN